MLIRREVSSWTTRSCMGSIVRSGCRSAAVLGEAQILLAADAGVTDEAIATSVGVKQRFVLGNLEAALSEEPHPGPVSSRAKRKRYWWRPPAPRRPRVAHAGPWSLELLASAMVKLTEHEGLSRETARRRLAENDLKRWRKDMWCIPQVDGEYVARMEDVLDLYAEAPDLTRDEIRQPAAVPDDRVAPTQSPSSSSGTIRLRSCRSESIL
jgi:hypothetical protein